MKIARFNSSRVGLVENELIYDVTDAAGYAGDVWPPIGMIQLIAAFSEKKEALERAMAGAVTLPLSSVHLDTPIPWPSKVIAYPVNYVAHGKEMASASRADTQGFFLKAPSSLSGASDAIVLPELQGKEFHHECELAIIIGRRGRHIRRADALDYIFGYACLIDVTVRGKQERVMRKSFDTFCPTGPWITTADEISAPENLSLRLWVNGAVRQDASTRDLILDIPGMIEMASSAMTLEPGDIIATGTPQGVGSIVPGDLVKIEIEKVGQMEVRVVQGVPAFNLAFQTK